MYPQIDEQDLCMCYAHNHTDCFLDKHDSSLVYSG